MTRLAASILAFGLLLASAIYAPAQAEVITGEKAKAICGAPGIEPHSPRLIVMVKNDNTDTVIICAGEHSEKDVKFLFQGRLSVTNPCTIYDSTSGRRIYIPPGCAQ